MMTLRKYIFGKTALKTYRWAIVMTIGFSLMLGPFAHAYMASTSCAMTETSHTCCCCCSCEPEEAPAISYFSHNDNSGCTCNMQAETIPITAPFEAQTPATVDVGMVVPMVAIVTVDDVPSTSEFDAIPEIVVRDTGPPLYIIHSSYLI